MPRHLVPDVGAGLHHMLAVTHIQEGFAARFSLLHLFAWNISPKEAFRVAFGYGRGQGGLVSIHIETLWRSSLFRFADGHVVLGNLSANFRGRIV